MNAALKAELRAGRPVFPMFEVHWVARGYSLGTGRYARGSAIMADGGPVRGLVPNAGFKEITYGPGMKGNTLVAATTSVKVNDEDGSIQTMLDTYDPRGSAATVKWVSPFLTEADFEPLFVGIVDDWKTVNGVIEVILKTDDAAIHAPGPKPIFSRSEWGYAIDPTTWGTAMPFVTGIHDSYKVTGRGMVPAINIRWNEDLNEYWWCASITSLKSIPRIYYDGVVKETGFTIIRGVYGSTFQTIISVDRDNAPKSPDGELEGTQVVSFDCEGPDASGGTSGASLTNPVAQLRAFLNNYVFRDNRLGPWYVADVSQIDTASWDSVEDYFDLYGHEGAFRIGGIGEREPALTAIESFLKARPWLKAWWTPTGKIALGVIGHADPDVSVSDWLNASTKVKGDEFQHLPGDRKDILSGVVVPYLYSHSEQKYLGSYEAHDIGVLPEDERTIEEFEDEFSQGRYDREET